MNCGDEWSIFFSELTTLRSAYRDAGWVCAAVPDSNGKTFKRARRGGLSANPGVAADSGVNVPRCVNMNVCECAHTHPLVCSCSINDFFFSNRTTHLFLFETKEKSATI